jgi:hypothetical protein
VNGECIRNNYRFREKHSFYTYIAKWPNLEAEVNNRITDHRNKGVSVSTKVIITIARRWVDTHSITSFVKTDSLVLQMYEKRHRL